MQITKKTVKAIENFGGKFPLIPTHDARWT